MLQALIKGLSLLFFSLGIGVENKFPIFLRSWVSKVISRNINGLNRCNQTIFSLLVMRMDIHAAATVAATTRLKFISHILLLLPPLLL